MLLGLFWLKVSAQLVEISNRLNPNPNIYLAELRNIFRLSPLLVPPC
jgi:hypothetical protein